ncbi:MAG: hypothetical protein ACI8WB_003869 [Phenylobacterium sp.]|jgi:hypothetical protein
MLFSIDMFSLFMLPVLSLMATFVAINKAGDSKSDAEPK